MAVDKLNNSKFTWKGLALHYGKRKTPVLTLVPTRPTRISSASDTRMAGRARRQISPARRTQPTATLVICWGRKAP